MKVLLINAPPHAGKDTAAAAIRRYNNVTRDIILERFSMPLKRAFAGTMGLSCDALGTVEPWERRKEQRIDVLGVSYRDWQIVMSQNFMKPLCGEDIFARLLWERIAIFERTPLLIIIPDCGFQVEADYLIERMKPEDVFLLRIERAGCDWDSRHRVLGTNHGDIRNDVSIDAFEQLAIDVTKSWISR